MSDGSPTLPPRRPSVWLRALLVLVTLAVLGALYGLQRAREQAAAAPPLAEQAKPVTVVPVRAGSYREGRTYLGTLQPWVSAQIGPQMTSGYVQSVLVRPGDVVQRGDVLATLDCRDAEAASRAVRLAAKALEAERAALAREAARYNALADDNFVSRNEADLKLARTEADRARALAEKARLLSTSLRVDDCILRAPVDGEVVERHGDPGTFIRPGDHLLVVMDRATIRVEAHAPEDDFAAVPPDTPVRVRLLSTGAVVHGRIARRSPAADEHTRTIHFEIDLDNTDRSLPVGTTARIELEVGDEVPVIEVPVAAASVRGGRATIYAVEDGRAVRKALRVVGERAGSLFLEPELMPDVAVVTQGRTLLRDGDLVAASEAPPEPSAAPAPVRPPADGVVLGHVPETGALPVASPEAAAPPAGERLP